MDNAERFRYEQSLKIDRDNKNTFDYAMEQMVEEVTAEVTESVTAQVTESVTAQVARTARQMGLSVQAISQLTGLTEAEVNSIE